MGLVLALISGFVPLFPSSVERDLGLVEGNSVPISQTQPSGAVFGLKLQTTCICSCPMIGVRLTLGDQQWLPVMPDLKEQPGLAR
jgi:hypothetical protein